MSHSTGAGPIVDEIYAAFGSGDLDKWLTFFDDESVLIEADSLPYGGRFKGREEIMSAINTIMATWDNFSYDVHEKYANETTAMVFGTISGTAKATGRKIKMPLVERWTIRDGKVDEVLPIYFDTKAVQEAVGQSA